MDITTTPELAKALAAFQKNLPKVVKDSQGNRGKYADLADLSPVILPALAAHGLSWSTKPTLNEHGQFVLVYVLRHESGEFDTGEWPLAAPDSAPQILGGAVTYARRYCLCAVTGVAPAGEDDDGDKATDNHRPQMPAQRRAPTNGAAKADKPAAKTSAQIAAGFVDALMSVENTERADKAVAATAKSPVAETDVTGLLTREQRETLDIKDGEQVTLNDLALLVSEFVAKHHKSVKDATEAVPA